MILERKRKINKSTENPYAEQFKRSGVRIKVRIRVGFGVRIRVKYTF